VAEDAKAGAEKARRQQAAMQATQRRLQEEKAAVAAELDTTKQALVGAQAATERAREEQSALKRELTRLRQDLGKSLVSARAQDVVVQQLESVRNDLARRLEAIEEERRGLQSRLAEAENQLTNARFTISEQKGLIAEQKGLIAELDTERAALGRQLTAAGEESRRAREVIARSDGARAGLERSLAEGRQQLQSCNNNRQGLDRTARELLLRYEQKTCQTGLMQAEPFLQLRRVTIESEVERYREIIDGFRFNSGLPPQR
jgi:chromosome segregation protein